MKTAMKRLFSLVLVAVLLVGVMPFQAFADEADPEARELIWICMTCGRSGHDSDDPHCTVCNQLLNDCTCSDDENETPDEPVTYTVEFYVDGAWVANITVDEDGKIVSGTVPSTHRDGFTFSGWTFGNGEEYVPGETVVTNYSVVGGTFVAIEPEPVTYTVELYVDGAWAANITVDEDGKIVSGTVPSTQRDGFTFSGWTFGNGEEYVPGETVVTSYSVVGGTFTEIVTPDPGDGDDDEDSQPAPDTKTTCKVCGGAVKAVDVDGTTVYMCEACSMDEDACTCEDEPENTQGKVKLTLDYNYWGAADTEMYVNRHDSLLKIIGQIPAPTRDGYLFDGWTLDSRGHESIDHRDYVSSKGTTKIYAQWIEQVQVVGKGYDIKVNLNYNHKMGETLKNVAKGTTMGDALEYINTPYRHGYKFLGWYWDPNCKNDVERRDVVLKDCTIYAKWERAASEVMLKIYTNGNTDSPAKIIDLYEHSHDDYISLWEVKDIVKRYYTAKDSDGLSFYGLFDYDGWKSFIHNRHHKGVKDIPVNENDDTVVYVMVHNAKVFASSSSGTADSSNPKTGDMIFTSVTVLGASASCLAVLFYLNKKRAI